VVVVEKMELGNSGGEGERMQFDSSSNKNDLTHKRFERLNSNKNRLKWYKECVASYCLNIPLGDEKVVFRLTHTSWR
jgi:hypothetical protein